MIKRHISCAAIKTQGGILSGAPPARHANLFHDYYRRNGAGIYGWTVHGFLDDKGIFIARREAYEIAANAGQLITPYIEGASLYTEDLWDDE